MKATPLLGAAGLFAVGLLVTTVLDRWRVGNTIAGVALCLAAVLRLSLRERQAGMLVVRSRGVDAAVLLGLGLALVALVNSIPATYLLDGEGTIIAKNLRGEDLEAAVAKALAKK